MTEAIPRLTAALQGHYAIERELGEGGMATVYLARDLKHNRRVALKVLKPELAAAVGSDRFLAEIETTANLQHPHILPLFDSGDADGFLYFVMPYVEGESLRDRLNREGRLSLDDTTRIAREVGSALAYSHRRGFVHRDIKPENILFQAGLALVCDFGVAKAASVAQGRLTRTGYAIGTLPYMSPEQASDEGVIDGRTDIYGLGCLIHEMLTGEAPFSGSNPTAVLTQKIMGEIPRVSSVRDDVPPTVEGVVTKALAVAPENRYQSSEELIEALEYSTTERAIALDVRRRRRERILRRTAALVALAVVGGAVWWGASLAAAPAIERVAVLPFAEGGDEGDFFVQGIYQDLTLELAKAGVRVKSPASAARYSSAETPIAEIAANLGVDGVILVSGTLQEDSVESELMIVDGETEEILWVGSFSGDRRRILSLLGDMTRAAAEELEVRLTPEAEARLAEAPEVDPAVFEALQRARFHWQTLTEEGLNTALDYYRLAADRDSLSAQAWLGLSTVWHLRAQQGLVSAEEANRQSAPALAKAEELDPNLSEVQSAIGVRKTWVEWEWDEGEAAFLKALERDPLDAATRAYYSLLLLYRGRVEESAEQILRAAEDDPFNTLVQGLHAQNLNARRRHEEAEDVLLAALQRDRGAPFLLSTLRTTYHLMGREEEALNIWRASLSDEGAYETEGDPEALAALEQGYEDGGYEGALRAVAELYVERSETQDVRPWRIGTLYTRAGMREEALHYLELAFEERDQNCPYLSVDPIFDDLRSDPRFQRMIDELGLPGSA